MSRLLSLVTLASVVAAPAMAEGELSGNVAFVTDYVFRGVTQTDGGPTIQGGFDYEDDSGFYVGAWGSGVDFVETTSNRTSFELDLYGGYAWTAGMFDLDAGLIYYAYPDAPDDPEQDFVEVYFGGGTSLGVVELGASVAYSPEFYAETGPAFYTAFSAGVPINEAVSVDVGVGFQDFQDEGNDNYMDYNVGLTSSYAGFDLDFRYIDTDGLDGNDESFVFTVGRSL